MKMEQSVPKRLHIKFRLRGITQKKAYNYIKRITEVVTWTERDIQVMSTTYF